VERATRTGKTWTRTTRGAVARQVIIEAFHDVKRAAEAEGEDEGVETEQ
jgi:hypothetical protein